MRAPTRFRFAVIAACAALLVAGCGRGSTSGSGDGNGKDDGRGEVPKSSPLKDKEEFPQYLKYFPEQPGAIDLVVSQMLWGWDAKGPYGWVNQDHETKEVTVVDGKRVTYSVDDPEYTIWMFGGSTTFGVGQRQDRTIASRLVKMAEAKGIRIEVVNYGVSGYVNWQESQQFADDLAAGKRPDLAIFLDGANDTALALERESYGLLDPTKTYSLSMEDSQRKVLADQAKAANYKPKGDLDLAATIAAEQYRRGVAVAQAASRNYDVPVVFFWQAQLYTVPLDRPLVRAALKQWKIDPDYSRRVGTMARAIAERSGVDPIDLTHVYDDVDGPVFFDQSHTNELGAEIEAKAMFHDLWPMIHANT